MSDFDSLREDIATVADSLARYSSAVGMAVETYDLQIRKLWADNAELRDELHALANRVENLTRAVTTAPAEVAETMMRPRVECNGETHVWHESRARFGEWCDCGTVRYGEQYLTDEQRAEVRDARQS